MSALEVTVAARTSSARLVSQQEMSAVLRLFDGLLLGSVAGYALLTAAVGLGSVLWAAELLTHFRVQWAVAGSLLALLCAARRMSLLCAVVCALAALHVLPVLPYVVPSATAAGGAPSVRVLQLNVNTANRRHEAVERLVLDTRPDVLALLEVNERWLEALAGLERHYPHRIARPREDNFGIAVLSRFPLDGLRLRRLRHDGISMVVGRFTLGSTQVHLVVAHAVPPVGPLHAALRDEQLAELSEIVRSFPEGETVLLGDLNTSPWSPAHRRLERSAGLRNGARGLGLHPTWPTGFRPLAIPLDHYLVSPGLRLVSLETGSEVGSDHLPVLAEIVSKEEG